MRIPRIYYAQPLASGEQVMLAGDAAHHVSRVLRMQPGQRLQLFDGSNWLFDAQIRSIDKKWVQVRVEAGRLDDRESPLQLHLGQVISRGEKMEFTVQKSVELGVQVITPLWSARCGVRLDDGRLMKKIQQWQKIAIAASEQCGRNRITEVRMAMPLHQWCNEADHCLKLNLQPRATLGISQLPLPVTAVRLLIGSEGGLAADELALTAQCGFTDVVLGPRVLRTETAALTAISALQTCYGDFS